MGRFRTLFRRFAGKDAPKADELLNLCMKSIQILSAQDSSWSTEDDRTEDYVMNRHQCHFLVGRLTETRGSLQKIQLSPLLDEKTIPVLEELHHVLLEVETVINASHITSSQWPRAAIEQSDMKETFTRLLYGVQWHVSVLLSILVDNSQESSITFEPALCEGQLSVGDEFSLLTAMKEDEESLKDRLRSVELDDPTEKRLAYEFLKLKTRSEEEDPLNTSYQLPENSGASENSESSLVSVDSTGLSLVTSAPDLLYLHPDDLDLNGKQIGRGASAQVKKMNLMGGKYAIKIFDMFYEEAFGQEMTALQRLGRHPHIVRLLGYSKEDTRGYLIMEKMDEDLHTVLSEISRDKKKDKLTPKRPLSDVQAVALMLQIGEGVKYIHSKGMAHRDLKSGNILVNLADPTSKRISSVKVADFGLTKTKNATHTYSNQTYNQGTSKWMAPEVIQGGDSATHAKFNLRKGDVYSFAIICFEILTGEDPYYDHAGLSPILMKEQVKAGTLRPNLPEDCPPKLAALIRRCWHPISHERPLFPEICKELRYIKGLLLRGDRGKLEVQDSRPLRALERAQIEGPWGGAGGGKFRDVGTSINRMKLRYSQSPGLVSLMEVDYSLGDSNLVRRYCNANGRGHLNEDIKFEEFEFITHISGYVSQRDMQISRKNVTMDVIVSLTIHTNIKSYGPFGDKEGEPFASATGRVIGFHGRCGVLLDSLGVVISLGDTL